MEDDRKVIFILVCSNRTCRNFEIWSADKVLMAKMNFNRDFALAREIIHDHENGSFFLFLNI